MSAAASSTRSRGATRSNTAHAAATSTTSPSAPASRSSSAFAAPASVTDAFSSFGIAASRFRCAARRAGLISRVAISTSNKSSASSTAAISNPRTARQQRGGTPGLGQVAQQRRLRRQPIAGQRREPVRRHPRHLRRARADREDLGRPCQRPLQLGLDVRVGARRSRSSSLTRTPGVTSSRTRFRRSHPVACPNSATGPSACVHARPARNARSRAPARGSVKSW